MPKKLVAYVKLQAFKPCKAFSASVMSNVDVARMLVADRTAYKTASPTASMPSARLTRDVCMFDALPVWVANEGEEANVSVGGCEVRGAADAAHVEVEFSPIEETAEDTEYPDDHVDESDEDHDVAVELEVEFALVA